MDLKTSFNSVKSVRLLLLTGSHLIVSGDNLKSI